MSSAPVYFDLANPRHDRPYLIFVEGPDDAHFLDVILNEVGANPNLVGVIIVSGAPKFSSEISLFKKSPFYRNARGIAVIRDADESPDAVALEINGIFKKELNVEVKPEQIVSNGLINVGLYIFPGSNEAGDLEKLCLSTVAGSQLERSAEAYLSDAQKAGNLKQIYKRKAQVYLAAFPNDLCRGAGLGVKKGAFDTSHKSVTPLKQFLTNFIQAEVDVKAA